MFCPFVRTTMTDNSCRCQECALWMSDYQLCAIVIIVLILLKEKPKKHG